MATGGLVQVEGDGFRKTMHALDLFAPDLRKRLLKDLRTIAAGVRKDAAAAFPVRSGAGKTGFKSSVRNRGDDVSASVFNKTPQSQILEFAGSKSSGSGTRRTKNGNVPSTHGQTLIRNLATEYGAPGRFMWAAYDGRDVEGDVDAAIAAAEAALQGDLEKADA